MSAPDPSRRAVLSGATAAIVTSVAAIGATASTGDTPIAVLMRHLAEADRDHSATAAYCRRAKLPRGQDDALCQASFDRMADLEDAVMEARAMTLADLAAKASIVGRRGPDRGLEWTDEHIYQLVRDVAAFAARNGKGERS